MKPYIQDTRAWRLIRSVYGRHLLKRIAAERRDGLSLRVAVARVARTIRAWERS